MNTEKRIALACFLGAALGTLLALQFNGYLWWIGIVIGGFVGYLSYQFKQVLSAIAQVAESTYAHIIGWKPDVNYWKYASINALSSAAVAVSWTVLSLAVVLLCPMVSPTSGNRLTISLLTKCVILGSIGFFSFWFSMLESGGRMDWHQDRWQKESKRHLRFCLRAFAPTSIVWYLPKLLIQGTLLAFRNAPTCVRISWVCFRAIHSDNRLLCLTDSLIGALFGYFLGNALVGGIIGTVCGVLNYRFISLKLLKLAKG